MSPAPAWSITISPTPNITSPPPAVPALLTVLLSKVPL